MKASFLFVAVALLAQGTNPDFTGRWEIDKSASTAKTTFVKHPELHGPPAPIAAEGHAFDTMRPQTIAHREPTLTIADEAEGNRPRRTFKLTTDGKPNVNELPGGGVQRSSTRWEGKDLVTDWTFDREGQVIMQGTDRRTLSEDGLRFTQEQTVLTPLHETRSHMVWIRRNR